MRISFVYTGTRRDGTLLGVTNHPDGSLAFSVKEDGVPQPVKTFLSYRMSDISTVLEAHEQVPGVFGTIEPTNSNLAGVINNLLDRVSDLEKRWQALDGKLDDVRIALTD